MSLELAGQSLTFLCIILRPLIECIEEQGRAFISEKPSARQKPLRGELGQSYGASQHAAVRA